MLGEPIPTTVNIFKVTEIRSFQCILLHEIDNRIIKRKLYIIINNDNSSYNMTFE